MKFDIHSPWCPDACMLDVSIDVVVDFVDGRVSRSELEQLPCGYDDLIEVSFDIDDYTIYRSK